MVQNMRMRAILRSNVIKKAADLAERAETFEQSIEDLRYVRDAVMREDNLTALIIRLDSAANRIQFAPNQKVQLVDIKNDLAQIQDDEAAATERHLANEPIEDPDLAVPSLVKLLADMPPSLGLLEKLRNLLPRLEKAVENHKVHRRDQEDEIHNLREEVDNLRNVAGYQAKYNRSVGEQAGQILHDATRKEVGDHE